ncbi:MAG: class I SAM-dependent methyltransferase [Anaerolineae bacterium]|jgi:ubiquinone/menaquinone biosynthesis C-methylase UbiE
MAGRPTGAGKSSHDLEDTRKLFRALSLKPNSVFLDAACGDGRYSLQAAEFVTEEGAIWAVDLWREGIEALTPEARARRIDCIRPRIADVSKHIPVEDSAVDVCLLAAAPHDFVRDGTERGVVREIARVLGPGGRLAVVEFKKMAAPPGPPIDVKNPAASCGASS